GSNRLPADALVAVHRSSPPSVPGRSDAKTTVLPSAETPGWYSSLSVESSAISVGVLHRPNRHASATAPSLALPRSSNAIRPHAVANTVTITNRLTTSLVTWA